MGKSKVLKIVEISLGFVGSVFTGVAMLKSSKMSKQQVEELSDITAEKVVAKLTTNKEK